MATTRASRNTGIVDRLLQAVGWLAVVVAVRVKALGRHTVHVLLLQCRQILFALMGCKRRKVERLKKSVRLVVRCLEVKPLQVRRTRLRRMRKLRRSSRSRKISRFAGL